MGTLIRSEYVLDYCHGFIEPYRETQRVALRAG